MEILVILGFFKKSVLKLGVSGSARERNPGSSELVLSGGCSFPQGVSFTSGFIYGTTVLCRRYSYPFLQTNEKKKLSLRAVKQLA